MNAASEALLRLLADGQFHSGEVIGNRLNMSRTAVWKKLQALSVYGLEVESIKGKGYRLLTPLEFLVREKITDNMSRHSQTLLSELEVLAVVDSTNSYLMDKIGPGNTNGRVCFAEYQEDGRGRRGREWVSPLGNIALSLSWEFEQGASSLEGLSLGVGVGVVQALADEGIEGVQLKWPNDILIRSAKLGGILIEMAGDPTGRCQVVIGIGLNTAISPLQEAIEQPYISLSQVSDSYSRNKLAAALLNRLLPIVATFSQDGFIKYRSAWESMDAYKDQNVVVISGQQRSYGVARGVNESGALQLEVGGELSSVHGGELSLRLSNDS